MKKILVLVTGGRPRGNTRQLAAAFAQGAREAGHEVKVLIVPAKQGHPRLSGLQRLPLRQALCAERRFRRPWAGYFVVRCAGVCLAALFLDDMRAHEGHYRALLQPGPAGRRAA